MENKNPTEILREEHDVVLEILNRLYESLEVKDIRAAVENISVLGREFDRHSLNKEELALFPEIERFIPREGGPTGMMIMEHRDLVESMDKFREAAKSNNMEECRSIGQHIVSLLRQHIDKENNILFQIADMHLDDEQQMTILKKFREIDGLKLSLK